MIHSLVLRIDTRLSRDQKEDAVGRANRQSPFLGDPNANFFCEKALMTENPPVTRRVESTGQPLALKIQLGLIVSRARKSKGGSRLTDRLLLDLDAAQHLVLDLDQVVGIEELALLEQRIPHLLRARMQTSLSP